MRLVVYSDFPYSEREGRIYGELSFALFLSGLADKVQRLTVIGRLTPDSRAFHYALPDSVRFVALPHYGSLTHVASVVRSMGRSLERFWRALDDADRVWLIGPYPHAVAFAVLALVRRRRVVLGVRQDYPSYVRRRRPESRWMHLSADLLEAAWRTFALRCSVVAVGPELAQRYAAAPRVLEVTASLVSSDDVAAGERAGARSYDGELRLLSVGRLDPEKNPLLLADTLERLRRQDPRWRLVVCGDGTMEEQLTQRLEQLGLSGAAELVGYVPVDKGLMDVYRSSHAFLHVSWTEGVPQVLSEAFASGLPVVATAVGGVRAAVDGAALLIPPDDADAAAAAVQRIAAEPALRQRLVRAGFDHARTRTLESETARVAAFIAG